MIVGGADVTYIKHNYILYINKEKYVSDITHSIISCHSQRAHVLLSFKTCHIKCRDEIFYYFFFIYYQMSKK